MGRTSGLGPEYQYDLTELRKVDPALVHYEESGRLATGLENPRAVALSPVGDVIVAGDRAVRIFDAAGRGHAEFRTDAEPLCLAAGPDGRIYVGLKDHVEVFDERGRRLTVWQTAGDRAFLTSIAAGQSDVFVADAGGRCVRRHDPSGRVVCRFGEKNDATRAPGFVVPSPYFDLTLAPDGMLWVVNPGMRRVECYTYEGQFRFAWGRASARIEGFCGCCNPTHLAVLPDGAFVTSEKGLPRVKIYGAEGVLRSVVAPPAAFDERATGLDLAVDSAGRVLVLDPSARAVRTFVRKKS